MDGGRVMAPRVAIGGLHGEWEVEGHGIAPDIEVQQIPNSCARVTIRSWRPASTPATVAERRPCRRTKLRPIRVTTRIAAAVTWVDATGERAPRRGGR